MSKNAIRETIESLVATVEALRKDRGLPLGEAVSLQLTLEKARSVLAYLPGAEVLPAAVMPMQPDEADGSVHGYMCKVDFECELGGAMGGVVVYPEVHDLREHRRCAPQCGIVKVAVRAIELVQAENYGEEISNEH